MNKEKYFDLKNSFWKKSCLSSHRVLFYFDFCLKSATSWEFQIPFDVESWKKFPVMDASLGPNFFLWITTIFYATPPIIIYTIMWKVIFHYLIIRAQNFTLIYAQFCLLRLSSSHRKGISTKGKTFGYDYAINSKIAPNIIVRKALKSSLATSTRDFIESSFRTGS